MDDKLNVLVIGASGSGKSTLIKSVAGVDDSCLLSSTKNIDVYESSIWPIKCIDTKGFEYKLFEQLKTISQIKKYSRSELKRVKSSNSDNLGIDVVWYCIDGTSRRTFEYNINLMKKALKKWNNIPVIVVVTKSYSSTDIEDNVKLIKSVFSRVKGINLKKVIPVVALEYVIDENVSVLPKGVDELCVETLNYKEEAKLIKVQNMIFEQKKKSSNGVIIGATSAAMVVGIVPIKIPDAAVLVPIELGLTKKIFNIYDVDYSDMLVQTIVGGSIITSIAKFIVHHIPIVGPVINSVVAGVTVYALGEGLVAAGIAIKTGKLDPNKVDETVNFIKDTASSSEIIDSTISYFQKNSDDFKNLKANDIFKSIKKSINNKK